MILKLGVCHRKGREIGYTLRQGHIVDFDLFKFSHAIGTPQNILYRVTTINCAD